MQIRAATLDDVANSMTQLQGDVAKIGARLVAIDGEVAAIVRRLDRGSVPDREGQSGRDLALEHAVFKKFSRGPDVRDKPRKKADKKSTAKRPASGTKKRSR